jgi:hypothetical protein
MDERMHADLERRVQAHEEVLTSLVAAVGLEHPATLTRLESMFAERRGGVHEPAEDTVGHAEQILRAARRLVGAN